MPSEGYTVSVIIPCYNAEAFVGEAVESAFAQTYPIEEVICVDDGSTDDTPGVLQRLQSQAAEPLVVRSQPNGGPSAARNLGLTQATGDYIQFLDADDLLEPDKIEHQMRLVRSSPIPPDMVAAAHIADFTFADRREVVDVAENPWTGLFSGGLGITSANLYRREAVLAVGGWNEHMKTSEDPELAFRIMQRRQRVLLDTEPRTTVRRRRDSQWNADTKVSMRGWLRLRMKVLEWVRDHGILSPSQLDMAEQKVFREIRSVHAYDRPLANEAYRTLSHTFCPSPDEYDSVYLLAYHLLGFTTAQYLRHNWLRLSDGMKRLRRARG